MRYHTCIAVTGNAVARFAGDLFSTAPGWVQACVMRGGQRVSAPAEAALVPVGIVV